MARDLPEKLALTRQVLGCRTQKELHAKLLRVNPSTSFAPERAYKWAKGVAEPRDPQLYADLDAVLELRQGGDFYADASIADFAAVVIQAYPRVRPQVEALLGDRLTVQVGAVLASSPPSIIAGHYVCFSPSWSVSRPGEIIVGMLEIVVEGEQCNAVYREVVGGTTFAFSGPMYRTGRVVSGQLLSPAAEIPVFFCVHAPSNPAHGLIGTFSGAALNDPVSRPCASRICCVRVPAGQDAVLPAASYIPARGEALAEQLAALGFDAASAEELAELLWQALFVAGADGVVDVPIEGANAFANLLYRMHDRA